MVRTADVARGWGKYYSKSCKARDQERRTGQYKALQADKRQQERDWLLSEFARREALIKSDRW